MLFLKNKKPRACFSCFLYFCSQNSMKTRRNSCLINDSFINKMKMCKNIKDNERTPALLLHSCAYSSLLAERHPSNSQKVYHNFSTNRYPSRLYLLCLFIWMSNVWIAYGLWCQALFFLYFSVSLIHNLYIL